MAKKKKKESGGNAPDWMVTYGDMMTLLFCFFVILVSMSEIKEDQKFQKVKESIKRAFGYRGGVGYMEGNISPSNSIESYMEQLIVKKPQLHDGKSKDDGIEGKNPSVRKIRDGYEYTIGGQVSFERGKARLLDPAKKELTKFASPLRGLNTKVRVRGHASRKSADQYRPYASLDALSYSRAEAVKEHLVACGIREERITVEACGDNEPIEARAYDEASQAMNRRVSIIVTESLVDDYQGVRGSDAEAKNVLGG